MNPGAQPVDMEGDMLIQMVNKAVNAIMTRLQSKSRSMLTLPVSTLNSLLTVAITRCIALYLYKHCSVSTILHHLPKNRYIMVIVYSTVIVI